MAEHKQQNNGANIADLMAQIATLKAEKEALKQTEAPIQQDGPTGSLLTYLQTSNEALVGGFNDLATSGVVRRSKAKVQSLIDFALFIGATHRGGFLKKEGATTEEVGRPAITAGWIVWLEIFTNRQLTAELDGVTDATQALTIREGADAVAEVIAALFVLTQTALFPKSRKHPHLGADFARKFSTNTAGLSTTWADPCEFDILPAIYDFIDAGYKLTPEQRAVIEGEYPEPTPGEARPKPSGSGSGDKVRRSSVGV